MNSIVFFGGSKIEEQSTGEISIFLDELLSNVKSDVNSVIYGGGTYGVMGIIKDITDSHGIRVESYSMEKYKRDTDPKGTRYFSDENERIREFFNNGTHFVGLPGGIGTFTEILTIGNYIRASNDSKEIFIPEFFRAFYKLIDELEKSGMLAEIDIDIFNRIKSSNDIVKKLKRKN